jgi:hypothetical protein
MLLRKQKPDWDTIFKGKENKIFSVIILDNKIIPSDIFKIYSRSC